MDGTLYHMVPLVDFGVLSTAVQHGQQTKLRSALCVFKATSQPPENK